MKRYFTFTDDSSNKFWQIETQENTFTVTYGRIGSAGQSQTKTFAEAAACQKEADKLIREKMNKGYLEEGQAHNAVISAKSNSTTPDTQQLEIVLARYDEILKNEAIDQLLPFLQSVEKQHYEGLKKHIKKLANTDISLLPSRTQYKILVLAVCTLINEKEIANWWGSISEVLNGLSGDYLALSIFEWAKPNWIVSYFLKEPIGWTSIPYNSLLFLEEKQLIVHHPELTARSLGQYILNLSNESGGLQKRFDIFSSQVKVDEKILQRDLQCLFEYETNIGVQPLRYDEENGLGWTRSPLCKDFFLYLLNQQKIDSIWVIENCLQTQLRPFSNNSITFFKQVLEESYPTAQELLLHQALIFSMLTTDNKHVVNFAIELLKTIHEQPEFDTAQMLSNLAPVLARSDSKTSLKTLLSILEKLLKTQPEHTAQISLLLINIFNTNDLTLQERAAKLIAKYANPADADLRDQLQPYRPQLLSNVPQLLSAFFEQTQEAPAQQESYVYRTPTFTLLREENRVKMPQNWEELLFLIGDFISDETPLKAEIVLNSIVLLKPTFPKDWREQFEVYYKKLKKQGLPWSWYVNTFLIHWYETDLGNEIPFEKWYQKKETNTSQKRLLPIQKKYQSNSNLPLLSLPTHEPYWIEPKTLVERLLDYIDQKEHISQIDFTIALSRLVRENTSEAIELCKKLPSQYADLMIYSFGGNDVIKFPRTNGLQKTILGEINENQILQELWAVTARSRFPENVFIEFNESTLASVRNVVSPSKNIVIAEKIESVIKHWQGDFIKQWTLLKVQILSKETSYSANLYSIWAKNISDCVWLFTSIPHLTETIYKGILSSCLKSTDDSYSNFLKIALKAMLQDGFIFREMSLWTLAAILLNQKREDRALAAEVLMHHIERQSLPLEELGQKLGYLLAEEYGPVARLTEGLELVKDISPLHNDALRQLIEYILQHILVGEESQPPKNTKKLLEIYVDVLVKTKATPSAETRTLLQPYQSISSLKSIVKVILEKEHNK